MVAFYKHHILDWRGGTASLSDRAYRVYHVIVEQIMLNEGAIHYHDRSLAGLANRSTRDLRLAIDELVAAGKIAVVGGMISNRRASSELVGVNSNREIAGKGGRKPREKSSNGARMVLEHSANGLRDDAECDENANDFNGSAEASLQQERSLKDKTRLDETEDISPPSPSCDAKPADDLDAEFADWWSHYPRKLDRLKALKAYRAARRRGVTADELKLGVMRYAAECDQNQTQPNFIKHGASWLNAGSWENAPTPPARAASPPINPMLKALFSGLDPEAVR